MQRRSKQRDLAAAAASAAFAQHLHEQRRAEPPSASEPVKCDCLNDCGDDPWLADGRAKKCDNYEQANPRFFECPRCGRRSYHPKDIEQGYCGASCHDWTGAQ